VSQDECLLTIDKSSIDRINISILKPYWPHFRKKISEMFLATHFTFPRYTSRYPTLVTIRNTIKAMKCYPIYRSTGSTFLTFLKTGISPVITSIKWGEIPFRLHN